MKMEKVTECIIDNKLDKRMARLKVTTEDGQTWDISLYHHNKQYRAKVLPVSYSERGFVSFIMFTGAACPVEDAPRYSQRRLLQLADMLLPRSGTADGMGYTEGSLIYPLMQQSRANLARA